MQIIQGRPGTMLVGILSRDESRVWAEGASDGRQWLALVAAKRREMREAMEDLGYGEGRIYASTLHGGRFLEIVDDRQPPTRERLAARAACQS